MAEREATISDAESDLLDALWERETATAREVADALRERRGRARTTVKTLLERMVRAASPRRRPPGGRRARP